MAVGREGTRSWELLAQSRDRVVRRREGPSFPNDRGEGVNSWTLRDGREPPGRTLAKDRRAAVAFSVLAVDWRLGAW